MIVEFIMLMGLFYATVGSEYPGPKTYTSQELYQQKLQEGNLMNVQKIDYFF